MDRRGFISALALGAAADSSMAQIIQPSDRNMTMELQNEIDKISKEGGGGIVFTPGNYVVDKLVLKRGVSLFGYPRSTTIKSSGVSVHSFLSSSSYANNYDYADPPVSIYGLDIDASYSAENTLVLRNYFSSIDSCWIFGAKDIDCKITSRSVLGRKVPSTLVNNRITNCMFGRESNKANFGLVVYSPENVCTDYIVSSCYFRGAKRCSFVSDSSAGMALTNNHFYGSERSAIFKRFGVGSVFTGNYFEDSVVFRGFLKDDLIGGLSANTFLKDVDLHADAEIVRFASKANLYRKPMKFFGDGGRFSFFSSGDVYQERPFLIADSKSILSFDCYSSCYIDTDGCFKGFGRFKALKKHGDFFVPEFFLDVL